MPLNIKLNDTNKGYELQIIQIVLEFHDTFPNQYEVAINTDECTLNKFYEYCYLIYFCNFSMLLV